MLQAKLVIVGGDAKAGEISLELPTTIGRGKEADLTIPHALVSRAHTKLFEREGQLWVEDLGSLNGTFVDNNRIESEQLLEPNKLLTLGNITFRAIYEVDQSARKTLPSNKLPNPYETVTIDPIADRQAASLAKAATSTNGNVSVTAGADISAEAETDFAEKFNKLKTVAEPEPVFEETNSPRSAISEIDSFDPEEIGPLDSASEIMIPKEMSPPAKLPKKPLVNPNSSTFPKPKPQASPTPKGSPAILRKSPVVQPVPQEAGIDLGISEHSPVASVSSVDIDLPDSVQATPASFIGKIKTGETEAASFVENFQIEVDSEQEADVDVARLDSFLKKFPK